MNKKQKTLNNKQEFFGFKSIVSRLKFKISSSAGGQVMIIALVFLAVVLIIASSLFTRVADFIRFGSNSVMKEQANDLAEAGVDYATQRLNDLAGAYPDLDGEGTDTQTLSTGQVVIEVENETPSLKTITVTGYVPNQTNPRAKRTVKVQAGVGGENIAFHYAVQVGTGGVLMSNSSTIVGNVYSNKPGTNSIEGYNSSRIEGEAFAHGMISSPDPTVDCDDLPCKHENQPQSEMPVKEEDLQDFYDEWKTKAEAGGPIADCSWSGTETDAIGPGKCLGNFTTSNSAQVTIKGPIYVTGNVSISNSSKVILDNSFGSTGTVFITDGTVTISNTGAFIPTNANPKGYILVVTTSTNNNAISIANQGATAIFYALDGGAVLSNEADVIALVAKKLTMSNYATLTYDEGLADAQFSSGPGGSWQIKKGTYKFTNSP